MALIGGVIRNSQTHTTLAFASACITGTFDCATTDGYGIWNALWGYEGVSVNHHGGGFFDKAVNYTSSDIAWFPAYGSYGYWKVVEIDPRPPDSSSSCFTGETLIQMADGSLKPIADVMPGEFVVGRNGEVNRVLDIERPRLAGRRLIGINGSPPFVTAEHPFLTDRGWAAIDPAATALENPRLEVQRLVVGSVVVTARTVHVPVFAGGVLDRADLDLEPVGITSLTEWGADPATVVYNLLLDGDHSYVANGFIVHNKTSSH